MEVAMLRRYFTREFPRPRISHCTAHWDRGSPSMSHSRDNVIRLHTRVAEALCHCQASNQDNPTLRFLIVVIILHGLGHTVGCRFFSILEADEHLEFPYWHSKTLITERSFPEYGFLVEEALFGGIIGIVFREEDSEDGEPPPPIHADFNAIDYLFMHCRDGLTYRLDPTDMENKLAAGDFTPFDRRCLQAVTAPKWIPDRTCATLNGDHLPMDIDESEAKVKLDVDEDVSDFEDPPPCKCPGAYGYYSP
ncbi:unnamed protein product [Somion occarium]